MSSINEMSNLQQRLLISGVGLIALLIVIYFSHVPLFAPFFALLTAGVICLALSEYYNIAKSKRCQPLVKIGLIGTVAYAFAIFLRTQVPQADVVPQIVLGMTLIAAFLYYFIKGSDPFVNLAITLFGFLYLTMTLSCIIDINYFRLDPFVKDGRWCFLYLLLVTKITDTTAFFVGKKLGQRKLSPYISPKKTWEGALGGICGALAVSILFFIVVWGFFSESPFEITFWQSIWLAILLSITAQFGDLAESLLKRDVGVKDSSHLPGLGGVLDIVDSLVFTAPLMYIFLQMQRMS